MAAAARPLRACSRTDERSTLNTTTVTTPNELEIRVERIFDAPRAHVYSVWTDPELIPEWWGDSTIVEEMDVRPGGTYRFRTAFGVVEREFREVEPPARLVQTFQNHRRRAGEHHSVRHSSCGEFSTEVSMRRLR